MAAGDFVQDVGEAESAGVASTTTSITVPAGGCALGNTLVVVVGGFQVASSATDTQGNTYTVQKSANDGNRAVSILTAKLTTALVSGNTITVTLAASATNEVIHVREFEGDCSVKDSDASATSGGTANPNFDTPDTATLTQSDDLYVMAIGRDGSGVSLLTHITTGLQNGTTPSLAEIRTTAGTSRSLHTDWKRLASTAAVDYQGTLDDTRQWGCALVCLKVASAGGATYNDSPSGTAAVSGSRVESLGASASAIPDGIVTVGTWAASAGTLATATDDPGSTGDADYAESADVTGVSYCEVSLTNVANPGVDTGHVIRFRGAKNATGGDPVWVGVQLYQGATFVAERWVLNPADGVYEIELTTVEAATITDYTDLRFRYGTSN